MPITYMKIIDMSENMGKVYFVFHKSMWGRNKLAPCKKENITLDGRERN